jgi:3-polyprenyl-4-hydroxybenzoate decarboxylase
MKHVIALAMMGASGDQYCPLIPIFYDRPTSVDELVDL